MFLELDLVSARSDVDILGRQRDAVLDAIPGPLDASFDQRRIRIVRDVDDGRIVAVDPVTFGLHVDKGCVIPHDIFK